MPIDMDPTELQAKAVIAAALIASRAVAVSTIPHTEQGGCNREDAIQLGRMIEYVYKVIVESSRSAT